MLSRQLRTFNCSSTCQPTASYGLRRAKAVVCRIQAAASASDTAESVKSLLTKRSYAPQRFVGPIKVAKIPGKRYGLTATANLPVGSLLLVVPALAVVFGPAGAAPSNAELVAQLEGQQLEPWQLQWMRLLNRQPTVAVDAGDGVAGQGAASSHQQQQSSENTSVEQMELLQQLLLHGEAADLSCDSAAAAVRGPSQRIAAEPADDELSMTSVCNLFNTEQLQRIVSENAYSEASEDIGASLLRELDPEAITGLWPEYALLNHSCAPNTTAVVVGRYLILRAVAPIMSGEELTGSYLGRKGFSPVAVRRAFLSGTQGFHCQCPRCMCEQCTFPTLYYPADNSLLGVLDPSNSSSSSGDQSQQQQQQATGLFRRPAGLSWHSSKQQQVTPSPQHMLLLELHAATEELAAAVQEAAVADTKRQAKQLDLLSRITERVDSAIDAIESVDQQLQQQLDRDDRVGSVQQAAKWLLAAVYPLLDLRVQLLELLLSSGELPVDDKYFLYDHQLTAPDGTLQSAGRSQMAAAGAAAAGRLSLAKNKRKQRPRPQGTNPGEGLWGLVSSVFSGWVPGQEAAGPVTKRQLLALYVGGLEQCVAVAGGVACGSDIHVVAALKYMDAVRQLHGVDSEQTRLAEGLCSRAHAARYGVMKGQEDKQLLLRLVAARRRQLLGISLARKMSVLAWESSSVRF